MQQLHIHEPLACIAAFQRQPKQAVSQPQQAFSKAQPAAVLLYFFV
jgi:hypothetical protein